MVRLSAIIWKPKNLIVVMNRLSVAGSLSTFIAISKEKHRGFHPLSATLPLMGLQLNPNPKIANPKARNPNLNSNAS